MGTGKRDPQRFAGNVLRYAETKAEREIRQQQEREEFESGPRIGKLKTAKDIARYQGQLIRRLEKNKVDSNKAYRLATMARMLANTIELGIIEKRVQSLEEHAKGLKQGQIERSEGDSDGNSEQIKSERVNPDWQE